MTKKNKSKCKKIFKIVLILVASGLIIGIAAVLYIFNMPHRDVQDTDADYSLTTSQIVEEYLADNQKANQKYLAEDGDSKILEISGTVSYISEDYNGQKVVLLKETGDEAGVSCSFTVETNHEVANLQIGEFITIKGVIRLGASYDEDLELYENVILEKSNIVL